MKTCKKCHVEKDESLFKKDSRSKGGFRSCCKKCRNLADAAVDRSEYQKLYRETHKERLNQYLRTRYLEKKSSYKAYREENRDAIQAGRRDFYYENQAEILARQRGYAKKSRQGLTDSYMRRVLIAGTRLSSSQVPEILIHLKRLEMSISRVAEDIENEKC